MGTSRSVAELSAKLQAVGDTVARDNPRTTERIALFMKNAAIDEAEQDVGTDRRFRNNRNRPVGARYKMLTSGIRSTAEIKATGPYSWLEYGVEPHTIIPGARTKRFKGLTGITLGQQGAEGPALPALTAMRLGEVRGRKRGRKMRFNDGNIRPYALNAGELPAQGTWTRAVERTQQQAGTVAAASVVSSVRKVIT